MRIANLAGRLVLLTDDGAVDVEQASKGLFDADPQAVYDRWDEFSQWAPPAMSMPGQPVQQHLLESPAPRPRQLLAVGLNYRAHTEEASFEAPDAPAVFAKFPTSIAGAMTEVTLPEGTVDWEAERDIRLIPGSGR
jgi:2-keto-4-pentenoate hydratase/2-oxohepta-3-ene-1,7-dioic acid hydratase in catechol pathway